MRPPPVAFRRILKLAPQRARQTDRYSFIAFDCLVHADNLVSAALRRNEGGGNTMPRQCIAKFFPQDYSSKGACRKTNEVLLERNGRIT